ncbi:plastocyanin/azurin family copper-binding protein [Paraconexibacter antarcticus]|uniref:Plastocyanin/azurin family copper-binding protein n=1 Tax=Paraconexibacter antarcticus TaxID=2949664 RepID=A0ABY5DT71_9ACTN|nr:plastocyanin/azurin family copper-binding protein [Paraconexibacter antarcticus]UTI64789.1 plastocyanin/azurin family copper-binding protein [Paraconexibacter antarcticus]
MPSHRTLPLLAVLATGLLAGCGSSSGSSSSSTSTPAPATGAASTATTAAPASGGVTITMKNIAFDPKSVTVKAGTKVTWTNGEAVGHNVTAKAGASFKSALLNQGQTFSFTPKTAGTIKYTCTIHPGMDGTIVVQ